MKILFRWLLMGVLVFGFVGCGGGGGDVPPVGSGSETNSTESTETNSTATTDTNSSSETNSTASAKPIFTSEANISVNENQTTALSLTATDEDSTTLTYSISDGDSADFDINAGVVTFKIAPDYETKNSYSFIASVSDGVNETNQSVTISITNIAETVPTLGSDINLSLEENTTIDAVIGSIAINDSGDTDISSFEINGTDSNKIAISTDGSITLDGILDYETKDFYEFNITAINEAGRSNTIVLEINVTDIKELEISLAVYDNNKTATVSDDILRIYFSQDIDTATRDDISANNYALEGSGDLGSASAVYSAIHKEDKITGQSVALIPYETNISILSESITDINGTRSDTNSKCVVSAYGIKKTGQTLSYEQNGTIHTAGSQKDDGYYQKGISHSYSRDDSKEVILDHITGLMWQDDANVSTVKKPWVTQANYDAGNYSDTSGDTATTYCSDLTLGGYSDWRLPSSTELESIVDYGKYNPSISTVFENTSSSYYWSSTTYKGYDYGAWIVHFDYGNVYNLNNDYNSYVRCVRAGE